MSLWPAAVPSSWAERSGDAGWSVRRRAASRRCARWPRRTPPSSARSSVASTIDRGLALDDDARLDYQTDARRLRGGGTFVERLRSADEVSLVADTLATGRHALARVRARVAGVPVPEVRPPCFFNPQHGPSLREVLWTQTGRGTRMVRAQPGRRPGGARVGARRAIRQDRLPQGPVLGGRRGVRPSCPRLPRGDGRTCSPVPATFGADPRRLRPEDGGQVDLGAVGGEGGH